jgi:hypothetical protein
LRWTVVATLLEELAVFTIPVVRDFSLLGLSRRETFVIAAEGY